MILTQAQRQAIADHIRDNAQVTESKTAGRFNMTLPTDKQTFNLEGVSARLSFSAYDVVEVRDAERRRILEKFRKTGKLTRAEHEILGESVED